MTLRLGFCGVGRWGRKLAEAFRACGAEIVAHDRRSPMIVRGEAEPVPGFGKFMPWLHQIADDAIDAIVAVAPPEITTQVALSCAALGKPVMATKPLFDHPAAIRAPFYVDFWRLWSDGYRRERDAFMHGLLSGDRSGPFMIALYGTGPIRSFPGAFDYGPHVFAMMLDMATKASFEVTSVQRSELNGGEFFSVEAGWSDHGLGGRFQASFGNGGHGSVRMFGRPGMMVSESGDHIGTEPKDAVIQKMCNAFMSDVSEGFVDTRLLNLSREGMALLRRIREEAK